MGNHCKKITKSLPVAQTGFTTKLNFLRSVMDRILQIQRNSPWKTHY